MKFRRLIIGYIAVLFSAFLAVNGYAKGDKERTCPQNVKCDLKLYVVATSQDASKCRNPILTTDASGSIEFDSLKIAANWINRDVNVDILIPSGQPYTLSKDPVFFTESLDSGLKGTNILKPSDLGIKVSGKEKDANIKFKRNRALKTEFYFGVNLEFTGVSKCVVDPKVVNGQ
jgi:hypothetical protein